MNEKYVRCNSHCKYPAYDKEEVDNLLEGKSDVAEIEELENRIDAKKQNTILAGTSEPSSDLGVDGDIYLKHE